MSWDASGARCGAVAPVPAGAAEETTAEVPEGAAGAEEVGLAFLGAGALTAREPYVLPLRVSPILSEAQ